MLYFQRNNLKAYLNKKQRSYLNIDDEGIVLDVDTIEDYEYVKKSMMNK